MSKSDERPEHGPERSACYCLRWSGHAMRHEAAEQDLGNKMLRDGQKVLVGYGAFLAIQASAGAGSF